ncbi:MAG: hypothetical protein ABJC62_11905 [Frankiaceae bacterium]
MAITVLLRGGSRDGDSTEVADEVSRLFTPSDAPGLLDIYEATAETSPVRGNEEEAIVFEWVGQESTAGVAPEAIHMPPSS